MKTALQLADLIDLLTRACGRLATVLLLGMIALVFYNVAGRYVFGTSPVWMQELEWHLLLPVSLLGITVLLLERGHVRVDVLYERFSAKTQNLLDLVSMIIGVAVALLFIKYSLGFVDSAFSIREGSPDPGGLSGRWILKGMIPVAFGLFALQCLSNAIRNVNVLMTGPETQ